MKNKFGMTMFVVLMMLCVLTVSTASAATDECYAKFTTYYPDGNVDIDDIDENTTWTKYETLSLDLYERDHSIYDITFSDVSNDYSSLVLTIIDDDDDAVKVFLTEGQAETVDGLRIKLEEIIEGESDGNAVDYDSDSPVSVYVEPTSTDKKYVPVNGVSRFNPSIYGDDDGWQSSNEEDIVYLHVKRVDNVDIVYDIKAESGDDPKDYFEDDELIIEIEHDDTIVLTIEYEKSNIWGGKSDETETYTLIVYNMGVDNIGDDDDDSGSTVKQSPVSGTYSLEVGSTKIIRTDIEGEWDEDSGYTVDGEYDANTKRYEWTFTFNEVGTYKPEFIVTEDTDEYKDSGSVTFKINEKQVTGNQGSNDGNNSSEDLSSNIAKVVVVLAFLGIGVGALVMYSKKKNNSGKHNYSGNSGSSMNDPNQGL